MRLTNLVARVFLGGIAHSSGWLQFAILGAARSVVAFRSLAQHAAIGAATCPLILALFPRIDLAVAARRLQHDLDILVSIQTVVEAGVDIGLD